MRRRNMATDESVLQQLETALASHKVKYQTKKMFGGMCFMVQDKMCFGTYKGGLMVRINPDETEPLLRKKGAAQMIHGGRPMKGYLFITEQGYTSKKDLQFWVNKCLEYNPLAKSSKGK